MSPAAGKLRARSAYGKIAAVTRFLRRLLPGLGLAVTSIAFTVLLLELAVRALNLAPPNASPGWFWRIPDPQTGWSLQPGASGRWFNPRYEYDVPITINSQGLRDVERSGYEKPGDVFRILLLGDSYVEGLRVPLEQSFGKVLERQLNQSAPASTRFEVVVMGVSGWGTDQELLWFRSEGIKYKPDLVVLAFYPGNDFQNNSEMLESANMGGVHKPFFARSSDGDLETKYLPFDPDQVAQRELADGPGGQLEEPAETRMAQSPSPLAPMGGWMQDHMALYRFLAPRMPDVSPGLARILVDWGLLEAGQEVTESTLGAHYVPLAYGVYQELPPRGEIAHLGYRIDESDSGEEANNARAWLEAFELTAALLEELEQKVNEAGANLAVVTVTAPEQVYDWAWQKLQRQYPGMATRNYDRGLPNAVLEEILHDRAIPLLDLLPIFREAASDSAPLHLRHDGHWTPQGEQLAGETLAAWLAQEGLVPSDAQ